MRQLLRWVIPGAVAALLLALVIVIVQQQGARTVLSMRQDGALLSARMDAETPEVVGGPPLRLSPADSDRLNAEVGALGGPTWSPDGRWYAASVSLNHKVQVALFQRGKATPTLISSSSPILGVTRASWSRSQQQMALLDWSDELPRVLMLNLTDLHATPRDVKLARGSGMTWGREDALMVTRGETITSSLALLRPVGEVTAFEPDDRAVARADGVVSPDAEHVAYLAVPAPYLGSPIGALWLADPDASNARPLAEKTLNLAPMWAPRNDAVVVTRYYTETERLVWSWVSVDGADDREIGPGTELTFARSFDRATVLDWSPDRRHLFFLADEGGSRSVYLANYDGSNAERRDVDCRSVYSAAWAPTSRALVINCQEGRSILHWVDAEREDEPLPAAYLPAWQP
jgi:hypothetical protein